MRMHWKKGAVSRVAVSSLLIVGLLTPLPTALAQSSSDVIAQNFSTASKSSDIPAGALVSSTNDNLIDLIELATNESVERLVGIVDNSPLVSLSSEGKQVPVVLTGTTSALVSDINGPIKSGDKITASPIAGVGMLATSDGQIVGTAQANLDESKSVKREITDKDGGKQTIHVQKIPVHVGVAHYNAPGSDFLPPFIQDVANSIAGRPVSLVRVLISGLVLLLAITFTIVMMYASTRSTISSLGRNPLGSKEILKGLYRSVFIAVAIVSGSLLATYLLLTL